MTTAEKLTNLNALRAINGKSPLKAWKQSVEKLEQALVAESDEALAKDQAKADFEPIQRTPTFEETMAATDDVTGEKSAETVDKMHPTSDKAEEEILEKAEAPKKDKKAPKKDKPAKGETIRSYAEHLLKTEPKLKHAEVAEKVRAKFKDAATSAASVAWYASKLRKR